MQLLLLNTPKVFIHSQSKWPSGLTYVWRHIVSLTAEGAGGDRSPRCQRVEHDLFCTCITCTNINPM